MPLIIATSLSLGIWIGSAFLGGIKPGDSIIYDKLHTIMTYIDDQYVDEISTDSLIEKALPDILAQLDPHTAYIPASDLQAMNDELDGSFSGIGITFNMLTDTITVLEVISGGPSEKVGIMAGDRIIAIDDSLVAGQKWSQERVIRSLRGPKDSIVNLSIKRNSAAEPIQFTVTRGDIPVTSIDACYMLDESTGFLKINKFGKNTFDEFLNSMVLLQSNGASNLILDLRGNGGGYMEPAILMANQFLSRGDLIVSTRGRKSSMNSDTQADGTGSFKNIQLAVLLDEYSASASEIFAGAIQDNDRGLIIGRRSFGKGLVQQQIDLPDQSAMRLTVARYYTPSGRCIQKSYTPGNTINYMNEIADRYSHGEGFSADSMHIDKSQIYHTTSGRKVYGGGGIIPDVYVPGDTTGLSNYYIDIFNAGLLQKFAFRYTDSNRARLEESSNVQELLKNMPSDESLLQEFVRYAKTEAGIPPRWYYINISRNLIVSQLKALIARDVLGTSAYYEVINSSDTPVRRAFEELQLGNAAAPIKDKPTESEL